MVKLSDRPALRSRLTGAPRRWARRLLWGTAVIAAAGLIGFVAALAGSSRLQAALVERSGASSFEAALAAVATAPGHLVAAIVAAAPVDPLILDVKFKNLHKLHEQRSEALRSGALVATDQDLVPADVKVGGTTVPSRVRLAGNQPALLRGDKWPLRIHTRGDGQVFGLRQFTLVDPALHDFQAGALVLDHLRHEDVIAPRSRLVDVTLNGKHIGLMSLEEFPATELFEHQQRRDGPILRVDGPAGTTTGHAGISALRPAYLDGSRKLKRALQTATHLMEAHLAGRVRPSDVFDVELSGRFLAVAEIWDAAGALAWRNLRFYFNPLTARFEPFAVATPLRRPAAEASVADVAPFAATLLADPDIRAAFETALARIARTLGGGDLAQRLRERQTRELRQLHREYPLRLPFDDQALLARIGRLAAGGAAPVAAAPPARPPGDVALPLPRLELGEVLRQHAFLQWNHAAQSLEARPGSWNVEGSLILPPGVGLTLPPGTVLRFQPKQGLIARGPLRFLGAEDAPVVLEGPPGRKRSQQWSGVYVVESARPSLWRYVSVRNTGGFRRHGWSLAGGVVFRKAAADLEHCSFSGNLSDDSLNVVRSRFSLTDVEILDSLGDAFDGDYANGSISGGAIQRAGGDAIDVGGSRVTVQGVRITDIRDKAISVGERSRLRAEGVSVEHASIGVASKNGSETEVTGSSFDDVSDVALVAYMNRPEFGPGTLTARGNHITRTAVPALAQAGSRVVLDDTLLPAVDAAIDRLHKDRDTEP